VRYDQNGFRNDHEIGEASVVVLGDSFVEAGLVPTNDLLTTRLNKLLGTEVANLGQSGYGPQQELIVLRRYGLPLKPRLVLWFFFEGNDLLDMPRYERMLQEQAQALKAQNSFKARSFTKNVLDLLATLTSPQPNQISTEANDRACIFQNSQAETAETLYFAYGGNPLSREEIELLEEVQAIFQDAQETSAENGAQFVLVFVPTKFRVYERFCQFKPESLAASWQANDLPQRLGEWAKAKDISFIDLTAALSTSAGQGELVYFPDDGHWNAHGHQVTAQAIEEFLRTEGLLKDGLSENE
jgi:hypothetical protein